MSKRGRIHLCQNKNFLNVVQFIQDKLLPVNSVIEGTRHIATQETVFVTIDLRMLHKLPGDSRKITTALEIYYVL